MSPDERVKLSLSRDERKLIDSIRGHEPRSAYIRRVLMLAVERHLGEQLGQRRSAVAILQPGNVAWRNLDDDQPAAAPIHGETTREPFYE